MPRLVIQSRVNEKRIGLPLVAVVVVFPLICLSVSLKDSLHGVLP